MARQDIWAVLTDAELLAALTPLVTSIDDDGPIKGGRRWVWHLRGIEALGVSVAPTFTEHMCFTEPAEIRFDHAPPDGRSERAGANGIYRLEALDKVDEVDNPVTRLSIDITLCVELPLPRMARRAVEGVMATSMRRTGDRFAANLYRHLGIDAATVRFDPDAAPIR